MLSVLVCVPTYRYMVDSRLLVSFPGAIAERSEDDQELVVSFMAAEKANGNLVSTRNRAGELAIQGCYDFLWFVDADTRLPAGALQALIEDEHDVATGLVRIRPRGYRAGEILPWAIYDCDLTNDPYPAAVKDDEPFLVDGCGAACLLIKVAFLREVPRPWFHEIRHPEAGLLLSEDLWFGRQARKVSGEKRIVVVPTVKCGHLDGEMEYR